MTRQPITLIIDAPTMANTNTETRSMGVASIGYVRIETTDQAAWMDFGTSILGLMRADREDADGATCRRREL